MIANDIREAVMNFADEKQARILQRFFQTAPGQYAEGDLFLGVRSPRTRSVVKEAFRLDPALGYDEVAKLLADPYHEVRFAGFLYLVERYQRILKKKQEGGEELIRFYLAHAPQGNNWDLVDCVAPKLLGRWLLLDSVDEAEKWRVMDTLAESDNLWLKRISMVSTWGTLQGGRFDFTLHYAGYHLHHPHHLMHKAVGWMLREMGKRIDMDLLRHFLEEHAHEMPRTALRYAIEKMGEGERQEWMRR